MDLNFIKVGASISMILFLGGYLVRTKDVFLHKTMNSAGILLFILAGLYTYALFQITGGLAEAGIKVLWPEFFTAFYPLLALVTFLFMVIMAVTGFMGKKEIHKKIHFIFFLLYANLYISGIIFFQNI